MKKYDGQWTNIIQICPDLYCSVVLCFKITGHILHFIFDSKGDDQTVTPQILTISIFCCL